MLYTLGCYCKYQIFRAKETNQLLILSLPKDEFKKMIKMQCDSGSCVSKQSHLFMESPKLEYDNGDVYGLKVFGVEIPM